MTESSRNNETRSIYEETGKILHESLGTAPLVEAVESGEKINPMLPGCK